MKRSSRWSALFALTAIAVVLGVAAFLVGRALRRDEPEPAGDAEIDARIPWVDLPASFEEDPRLAATAFVGGVHEEGHATDGDKSFHVFFSPAARDGLSCRPGALRTRLEPGRRLLVDAVNVSAPFPVSLLLSDGAGRDAVSLGVVPVPRGTSTLEFALDVVERETRRLRLADASTFRITYALADLDRTLDVFFDNLRLAADGPLDVAGGAGQAARLTPDPENLLPDGEFELGFSAWVPIAYPGGVWKAAIVTGPDARDDGPSLALQGLTRGSAGVRSAEVSLEPGEYDLAFAVRGHGDVDYVVVREELRGGAWVRVGATSPVGAAKSAPERWETVEETIRVSAGEPSPRPVRIEIDVQGAGDVFVDSVRLVSRSGALPDPGAFDLDGESTTPDETAPGAPLAWNGRSFAEDGRAAYPILYRRDDVAVEDEARLFALRCRELGLGAALDVGGAFHGAGLDALLHRVRRWAPDGGFRLWLLSGDVEWPLGGMPPSKARHAARLIGEVDRRLVAVGMRTDGGALVHYNFAGAADVVVVGGPGTGADSHSPAQFERALDAAIRASGDGAAAQPLLAHLDAAAPPETLALMAHLAWMRGADGILLGRFRRQADARPPAPPVDWSAVESLVDTVRRRAGDLAGLEPLGRGVLEAGPVKYREARTREGGTVVIAANLSSAAVADVEVECAGGVRRLSLGPWAATVESVEKAPAGDGP